MPQVKEIEFIHLIRRVLLYTELFYIIIIFIYNFILILHKNYNERESKQNNKSPTDSVGI